MGQLFFIAWRYEKTAVKQRFLASCTMVGIEELFISCTVCALENQGWVKVFMRRKIFHFSPNCAVINNDRTSKTHLHEQFPVQVYSSIFIARVDDQQVFFFTMLARFP